MERLFVSLATTALLSGGVAGVVGPGAAQARPGPAPPPPPGLNFCPIPPWCP